MHQPNYSHPAAPARAIPQGEDPLVTRAKLCTQLRATLQILEEGDWNEATLASAKVQLMGAQRVLFVAQVPQAFPGLPAHVRVGGQPREAKPARRFCCCGTYLRLEMERDQALCLNCQAAAAGVGVRP